MSSPVAHHDGPSCTSAPCPGLGQNVDLLVRIDEPIANARAVNLTGGPDLIPGQSMPGDGPAFHIGLVCA